MAIYERGAALESMLARKVDKPSIGPTGIRKSPKWLPPGAQRMPYKAAIYSPHARPERRAKQIEAAKLIAADNSGKPRGYRFDEIERARAAASLEAQELVAAVAEKLNIEDDRAKTALEFAVEVVKDKTNLVKDRLAAARLTLDFTQPKPASRTELEIKKAEDFLDAIAEPNDPEATGNS
jgi:hypothetical protein